MVIEYAQTGLLLVVVRLFVVVPYGSFLVVLYCTTLLENKEVTDIVGHFSVITD